MTSCRCRPALGALLIGGVQSAAAEDISAGWLFKLTPAYYATSRERDAMDVNLRANLGPHALWLGQYWRGNEFRQTRAGYEVSADMPFGRLTSSMQVASRGFAGGSLNAEVGDRLFGLLGFGRTNARDYYNLNFDPNDSALYGVGTRLIERVTLSAYQISDNRLHTEQRVRHLVWRYQADERHRWTVDLFAKRGRATREDEAVAATGLAVTYDFDQLFLRAAYDPKVNFSTNDQARVALGFRF